MTANGQIARAVRRTLFVGAMAAASSMPLHAQDRTDADASNGAAVETVTVTGSRIVVPNERRQVDYDIARAGVVVTYRVLR